MQGDISHNYDIFRDCLFTSIVEKLAQPSHTGIQHGKKKKAGKTVLSVKEQQRHRSVVAPETGQTEDLVEFAEYLANETFEPLPVVFKDLTYPAVQKNKRLCETYSLPLSLSTIEELASVVPPSVIDSLTAYGLIEAPTSDLESFISPVLSAYVSAATAAPPKWTETRTSACEICERDWIPLTYHHLIPRQIHSKALKKGWHDEQQLKSVAWLCRACHSFVHSMAGNEELAREWYTVEKILARDDVQKWAQWVRRVRWKKR